MTLLLAIASARSVMTIHALASATDRSVWVMLAVRDLTNELGRLIDGSDLMHRRWRGRLMPCCLGAEM
jgi:hypothetical protein